MFFPSSISESNKTDINIGNFESAASFKSGNINPPVFELNR